MKIRKSFVSNSSSSSFILPEGVDTEEVLSYCKKEIAECFSQRIDEIKMLKDKYCSNWEDVIGYYQEDIKNLSDTIKICQVKDCWLDISEDIGDGKYTQDSLILYDTEDNILNCIYEKIVEKYGVKYYACHI